MAAKFGVFAPQGWRMDLTSIPDPVDQFEAMVNVAVEAEKLGFDSVWLYDHFHTVPDATLETTFECWLSTTALARATSTIRVGQMVGCNSYRNPALLAKMASTIDVLSHGRLDFGIGAGWYEHEYNAYGYPFPDGPTRLKMLREALQIFHAMWQDDYATVEGQFYQVRGAINEPKGVQKPHIPIWIGGGGEKVTLKLVAQYGDACNFGGPDPEFYRHKLEVLRGHCEDVGRDYNSIIKSAEVFLLLVDEGADIEKASEPYRSGRTLAEWQAGVMTPQVFIGTPQQAIEVYKSLMAVGVDYFITYLYGVANLEPLRRFAAEILPAFSE